VFVEFFAMKFVAELTVFFDGYTDATVPGMNDVGATDDYARSRDASRHK
jgi:hypothetical protein